MRSVFNCRWLVFGVEVAHFMTDEDVLVQGRYAVAYRPEVEPVTSCSQV